MSPPPPPEPHGQPPYAPKNSGRGGLGPNKSLSPQPTNNVGKMEKRRGGGGGGRDRRGGRKRGEKKRQGKGKNGRKERRGKKGKGREEGREGKGEGKRGGEKEKGEEDRQAKKRDRVAGGSGVGGCLNHTPPGRPPWCPTPRCPTCVSSSACVLAVVVLGVPFSVPPGGPASFLLPLELMPPVHCVSVPPAPGCRPLSGPCPMAGPPPSSRVVISSACLPVACRCGAARSPTPLSLVSLCVLFPFVLPVPPPFACPRVSLGSLPVVRLRPTPVFPAARWRLRPPL
jgi:hypothetical protein